MEKLLIRLEFKDIGYTYAYDIDWNYPVLPRVGDKFYDLGEFITPEQFKSIIKESEFPDEYRPSVLKYEDQEEIADFLNSFSFEVDMITWRRKEGIAYPLVYLKHVW